MSLRKRVRAFFPISKRVSKLVIQIVALKNALINPPGNTYVTIAPAVITNLNTDMDALVHAEADALTRGEGLAAIRDIALAKVIADVWGLQAEVQSAADLAADEATATALIQACGMKVRKTTAREKPNFEVKNDKNTSGLIILSSKAAPQKFRASYEWQFSLDGLVYTTIRSTIQSRFKWASGIAPGTKVYFRKRVTTNEDIVEPSWSQVFILYTT